VVPKVKAFFSPVSRSFDLFPPPPPKDGSFLFFQSLLLPPPPPLPPFSPLKVNDDRGAPPSPLGYRGPLLFSFFIRGLFTPPLVFDFFLSYFNPGGFPPLFRPTSGIFLSSLPFPSSSSRTRAHLPAPLWVTTEMSPLSGRDETTDYLPRFFFFLPDERVRVFPPSCSSVLFLFLFPLY